MQKTIFFLLILLCFACNQQPDAPVSNIEFPELLQRTPGNENGKEWDHIQNKYATLKAEISNQNEAAKHKLELAQLFTIEARITGEHGHYYPAAQDLLNEIINDADTPADIKFMALTTLAGVQLSLHEFTNAWQTGQKAYALNPRNAQIHGVLADALVELGRYEEAVKFVDQMVAIRPDIRSYARVSYLREIHGMPNEAIEAMQMAATAGAPGSEDKAWAMLQLGEMYERYDEAEKAEAVYKYILEERPDYPFALAALANQAMEQEAFDKAEQLLQKACALIPEVGFYETLAHLYQKNGQTEKAKALIPEILEMLEDDVQHGHQMQLEYANVYQHLVKDYEQAEKYILEAYEERPENIDVNRQLASLYSDWGKIDKASFHLQKAKSTNSKHPELQHLEMLLASN